LKIFIDIGAYIGDTLAKALNKFKNIDYFYAFEPYPDSFNLLKKQYESSNIICINKAVGTKNEIIKLYLHKDIDIIPKYCVGNSTIKEKINVSNKFIKVECVDFNEFLNNFNIDDEIILKIDIEGGEYKLLNHLLKSNKLNLIKKIYCEWHYAKIGITEKYHNLVIKRLNNVGFDLKGTYKDIFQYD
jgi:FkbM family methyltransferase